jgi:hypothetical protein
MKMRKGFGILAIILAVTVGFFIYAKQVAASTLNAEGIAVGEKSPSSFAALATAGAATLFKAGSKALMNLFKGGVKPAAGAATGGTLGTAASAGVALFVGVWVTLAAGKLFGRDGLFGQRSTWEELGQDMIKDTGATPEEAARWVQMMKEAEANGTLVKVVSKTSLKAPVGA